jgi:hypothetical protein
LADPVKLVFDDPNDAGRSVCRLDLSLDHYPPREVRDVEVQIAKLGCGAWEIAWESQVK